MAKPKAHIAEMPPEPIADVAPNGGRSKFCTPVCRSILVAVRKGLPRSYAAALAGISERTLKTWVSLGRENLMVVDAGEAELDALGTFALALFEAESAARAELLGVIRRAAIGKPGRGKRPAVPPDLASARWLLERQDGRSFGALAKLEAVRRDEDGDEQSVVPDAAEIIATRLDDMERRLASATSGPGSDEAPESGDRH